MTVRRGCRSRLQWMRTASRLQEEGEGRLIVTFVVAWHCTIQVAGVLAIWDP